MNAGIEKLSALDGVTGLFVHRGGIIKWQRRPDALTNDNAGALCSAVSKAFASYARAERRLTQAYFEFGGHCLLTMAKSAPAAPEAPDFFLTFLIRDRPAVAEVIREASDYLESAS
jgi:hypothetical protein